MRRTTYTVTETFDEDSVLFGVLLGLRKRKQSLFLTRVLQSTVSLEKRSHKKKLDAATVVCSLGLEKPQALPGGREIPRGCAV